MAREARETQRGNVLTFDYSGGVRNFGNETHTIQPSYGAVIWVEEKICVGI